MASIWRAVLDDKTCRSCRVRDGREIGEGKTEMPPNTKCSNVEHDKEHCALFKTIVEGDAYTCTCGAVAKCRCVAVLDTAEPIDEAVDHPAHYGGGDDPYEHVKVAEARGWDKDAFIYNCTKYLWRFGKKASESILKDLRKARWYLDRRIKQLETEENRGDHEQS